MTVAKQAERYGERVDDILVVRSAGPGGVSMGHVSGLRVRGDAVPQEHWLHPCEWLAAGWVAECDKDAFVNPDEGVACGQGACGYTGSRGVAP